MLRFLGRADGGDHLGGTEQLRYLTRIVPDSTATTRHQHDLPLGRRVDRNGAVGRQGRDAETGSGLEGYLIGQSDGLLGGERNVGRGGPEGPPVLIRRVPEGQSGRHEPGLSAVSTCET